MSKSTDGGQTWGVPTIAATDPNADKCWLTVGPNPQNLGQDIVYVVYQTSLEGNTHFVRSLDTAASFQDPSLISGPGNHFPQIAAQGNGRLFAVYQRFIQASQHNEIRLNYSDNGGLTWQPDDQVVGTTPVARSFWFGGMFPGAPLGINPVPSVAVANAGPYAGRVFVSYTSATNPRPDSDITVAWSDDPTSGKPWTSTIVHSTTGTSAGKGQFFSWVSTDPMTGVPYVSWLDCRNSSDNTQVQRFATASTDGGQSWLPEIPIADALSDQSANNPNSFSVFNYGHYIANSAFGGMSFDAWPDNSNSTGDNVDGTAALDIYTDRMILGGHVITATGTSGNDVYHVQMDPSETFVRIWENTNPVGTPTFAIHKDALRGLVFDLGTGTDTLLVSPSVLSYVLASGGFIDLDDNHMIVDYSGGSPIASVQSLLTSGYNGAAWTGNGIRSSTAAANASSVHQTGIGFAEATDLFTSFPASFGGQSVDNTSVLLRHTYYGDANLTGGVNLEDFNRLASNFGQSPRRWSHGDFNFDSLVSLPDFNRLAANFGQMSPDSDDTDDDYTQEELEAILDEYGG